MQCLSCSEVIDDDSCYCDMCGTELRICPTCKTPVAGKCCTQCGTPSILAASRSASRDVRGVPDVAPDQLRRTSGAASTRADVSGGRRRLSDIEPVRGPVPRLRLRNKNLGIDLEIADNSTIGRTTGGYVAIFGSFKEVSSRHCSFSHDPIMGWCVTDLGSTYKTQYNSRTLAPNLPQAIGDGTFLKIANLEFFVSIGAG
jgi:hypothetical protein